jgi:peptide/nickel transport system substrate-binding protein
MSEDMNDPRVPALEVREIDMAFNLPVESLPRLRSRDGLGIKSVPVGYQYMMWFNTRRPARADVRVRQALGLAIDRRELVQAVRAGEVATGAFPLDTPHALRESLPTDTAQAARLLDEAGWLRGADGRRSRDGQALRLVLVAYPQRPDLVTLQPVIRARYAALGIEIQTRVAEQPSAVASSGDFDLLLWAQHTLPAGDPGFFLEAFFRSGSRSNFPGLSSPEIDRALDRLAGAESPAERAAAAAAAHRAVIAQAPVSFLMTPVWHVGLGSRLAGYEPWGSDYHVVRADMGLRR